MTVVVVGTGLHSGAPARVTLAARPGATAFAGVSLSELSAVRAERATAVLVPRPTRRRISTVEHLFAGLAAFGAREGLAIDVEGPELPIVDGCAVRWCEALASLGVRATPPALIVARRGEIAIGGSVYEVEPADGVRVEVRAEWGDARLAREAAWDGDLVDFVQRIAPARTFAFAAEIEHLLARGLAKHVEPTSVVVVAPDALLAAGRPAEGDEPVRHKLLDLVGDLFLYGGPPRGRVRATRPGHWITHEAMRRALAEGLLRRA